MQKFSKNNLERTREVVVVDDQNLFAEGFAKILESINGVKFISTIKSGAKISEKLDILKPDVLFLDLNLPGKNGLEILKSIRKLYPQMVIAILTMYEDTLLVNRVKENHANAYLSKDASIEELEHVIFSSPQDPFFTSKNIKIKNHTRKKIIEDSFTDLAQITHREKEIICLIAEGKSTQEISAALFISSETVKTHRKNIFRKLNLKKVPELIKFAYEYHIL